MKPSDPPGRLLVVEDEDAIRLSLRDYLKHKGYEVMVASDGVGAIKLLLDNSPDLIITDYKMDVLGGDYWVRFLRRFCGDLPVIVTTGFLRPDFAIPYEVLYKPFEYAALAERVATILASRR